MTTKVAAIPTSERELVLGRIIDARREKGRAHVGGHAARRRAGDTGYFFALFEALLSAATPSLSRRWASAEGGPLACAHRPAARSSSALRPRSRRLLAR